MANIGFCRSCRAAILWTTTTSGKKMPLDIEAVEDGNVLLQDGVAQVLGEVARAEAKAKGARLFVSHFATCVNAKSHRKVKP